MENVKLVVKDGVVEAEKKDDSMSQLKIVLKLIDGTKLGEAQTVEPYGKVSITLAIG